MIIIDYQKKNHNQIINACVHALRQGKVVAYPTDTSYGLAVDATSLEAVKQLYKIKERGFNKPVHVIVPSARYAKKIAVWNRIAEKLSRKFWPGKITLVLPVGKGLEPSLQRQMQMLSARSGFAGLRYPNNQIALDLAKCLKRPITATSANPSAHLSGGFDSYSAQDVISQFKNKKYQPDIIINAGKLPRRKPSTVVKIDGDKIQILRKGPVSEKQIRRTIN